MREKVKEHLRIQFTGSADEEIEDASQYRNNGSMVVDQ